MGAPPQPIHELVLGNGMYPCGQWLRRVIGVALIVHGQKRFLHEILHIVRQIVDPFPQKAPQMRGNLLEKGVVGNRVAAQPECSQPGHSLSE